MKLTSLLLTPFILLSILFNPVDAGTVIEHELRYIENESTYSHITQKEELKSIVNVRNEYNLNDNLDIHLDLSNYGDSIVRDWDIIFSGGDSTKTFSVNVGRNDLFRGFFVPYESSKTTGIILPNFAVYQPNFSEGLTNSYDGVRLSYSRIYNGFDFSVNIGYGKGHIPIKEKAEYGMYNGPSVYTEIKQGNVKEFELNVSYLGKYKGFFLVTESQHYIRETDYSKSLSLEDKYLAFLKEGQGATFIGAVETPYELRITRLGLVVEEVKYGVQVESYHLNNHNDADLPFELYNSSGWFVLGRHYITDYYTLYASYGQSRSHKSGTPWSKHKILGIQYQDVDWTLNLEYHDMKTSSWVNDKEDYNNHTALSASFTWSFVLIK